MLIHHSDFIACSGYFTFIVYTWGIFLAYIRHRLPSWLCFRVFSKARRNNRWEKYYYSEGYMMT